MVHKRKASAQIRREGNALVKRGKMLIVGAGGGIGRAVRQEAERRGWRCVCTSHREGVAEHLIDCTDRDGLEQAFMRLFLAEGPFDAVAYCAGTCPVKPLSSLDGATLAETRFLNCDAFILLVRQFSRPGAYATDGAMALAVSSVSAMEGWAGGTAYCASKGALSAACRAMDMELAAKKIRVQAIEPGHVLTEMFRKGAGRMGVPESAARSPESVAREMLEMIEG